MARSSKKTELRMALRQKALPLLTSGMSIRAVATQLKLPKSTVADWKRSGESRPAHAVGRPKLTTLRQDNVLKILLTRNPKLTSRQLAHDWGKIIHMHVSYRTVVRRMKLLGFRNRYPPKRPLLTRRHRKLRREFAQKHIHRSLGWWRRIIWSDEKLFRIHDGKKVPKCGFVPGTTTTLIKWRL